MSRRSQISIEATTATRGYSPGTHTVRLVLAAFLFTFMAARILVFLIMSRSVPDLCMHLGGTHIHHLNLGIVLLSLVGAWLLLRQPAGREASLAAAIYGVGLALTFDEFGMWLHLSGGYWRRASFDAIVVIASILGLLAFAPAIRRFRPHHWATAVLLAVLAAAFAYGLAVSFHYAGRHIGPIVHRAEQTSPS